MTLVCDNTFVRPSGPKIFIRIVNANNIVLLVIFYSKGEVAFVVDFLEKILKGVCYHKYLSFVRPSGPKFFIRIVNANNIVFVGHHFFQSPFSLFERFLLGFLYPPLVGYSNF